MRIEIGLKLATLLCSILSTPVAGTNFVSVYVDERPAIGFHLGQSYGTAVAHLPNGTILELAKIDGSLEYRAFLQHQLLREQDSRTNNYRPLTVYKKLGILANKYIYDYDAQVLAEMLRALRISSEKILGAPLPATVVIGAPYMLAWQHEEALLDRSVVARARRIAGLPHIIVENMDPTYLAQAHGVLAANGQELCQNRRCYGPETSSQSVFRSEIIYMISLTNESLYTSFQLATCFFHSPVGARLGTINPDFGLLRQDFAPDKREFWDMFGEYLVARWADHARDAENYRASYTLILAGEGADNVDFRRAVNKALASIQHGLPGTGPPANFTLLVSQEPTFAAARGVALWRRTMIDSKYCADYDEPPWLDDDDDEEWDITHDEL